MFIIPTSFNNLAEESLEIPKERLPIYNGQKDVQNNCNYTYTLLLS